MIVLASASPRRADLLGRWGVPFRVLPAEHVEEILSGTAEETAVRLAREKAESVLRALAARGEAPSGLLVVGADTVVEAAGTLLGKPRDRDEARAMLERLAGRVHRVVTGLAVSSPGRPTRLDREVSEVTFHPVTGEDLARCLETGDWEGKAGAYGIQSAGGGLVRGFRGCYYNIVGLPLRRLLSLLEREGLRLDAFAKGCGCAEHPLWRGGLGCGLACR